MPDPTKVFWRTGMSPQARTIYAMVDGSTGRTGCDDPEKHKDVLIGTMDTHELAQTVVDGHNLGLRVGHRGYEAGTPQP